MIHDLSTCMNLVLKACCEYTDKSHTVYSHNHVHIMYCLLACLHYCSSISFQRGYVFRDNPVVKIFPDIDDAAKNFALQLAIDVVNFGRTFQDRWVRNNHMHAEAYSTIGSCLFHWQMLFLILKVTFF